MNLSMCSMLCSWVNASHQQHRHSQINLLCLFPLCNEIWNNSGDTDNLSYSKKIFILYKKIVRSMVGVKHRNWLKSVFKGFEVLPLPYEYVCMYPLMNFTVSNHETFPTNSTVHSINTSNTILTGQLPTFHVFSCSTIFLYFYDVCVCVCLYAVEDQEYGNTVKVCHLRHTPTTLYRSKN